LISRHLLMPPQTVDPASNIVYQPSHAHAGGIEQRWACHHLPITHTAYLPVSDRYITCSQDGTFRLWDGRTLEPVRSCDYGAIAGQTKGRAVCSLSLRTP